MPFSLSALQVPFGARGDSPTPLPTTQSFWESIRESATARVVLPDGVPDLGQAARRFLETLTPEQWTQLDQSIQDQVLAGRDGLQKALLSTTDLTRHLMTPLLSQAVSCLCNHLPITDVAQVELAVGDQATSHTGVGSDLVTRINKYYGLATPPLLPVRCKRRSGIHQLVAVAAASNEAAIGHEESTTKKRDQAFLLVPASEDGKHYGEQAQRALEGLQLVNVPGQADLMFCREQTELSLEDLDRILRASRPAYEEAVNVPLSSPHARFDIQDWMPLDP